MWDIVLIIVIRVLAMLCAVLFCGVMASSGNVFDLSLRLKVTDRQVRIATTRWEVQTAHAKSVAEENPTLKQQLEVAAESLGS